MQKLAMQGDCVLCAFQDEHAKLGNEGRLCTLRVPTLFKVQDKIPTGSRRKIILVYMTCGATAAQPFQMPRLRSISLAECFVIVQAK